MKGHRGFFGTISEMFRERGTVKRSSFFLFIAWLVLFSPPVCARVPQIDNHRPIFHAYLTSGETLRIALRQFEENREPHLLVVDPISFEVKKIKRTAIEGKPVADIRRWEETPFCRALKKYTGPPHLLRNSGIRRAEQAVTGLFLTVDLCPSKKPLDRKLFRKIAECAPESGLPVPVGVAVSGIWIKNHPEDFRWLVDFAQRPVGGLRITWINHTYSHPYDSMAPLEENFLLRPGIDFSYEVLQTEIILLRHNLLPAPFFRFPGLVSNRSLMEDLRKLSLVPVGSGAWLGKGELSNPGDIVLVHGNGNEPRGTGEFYRLLSGLPSGGAGSGIFLPLASAFAGEIGP